jgi:hypothetical protein
VPEQARIGSKGFRGSQEHRWVTVGPEARLEMESWLHHLEADTPSISPLQLKWDQQQLVLSHSGLQWAVEVSDGGAQVQERVIGPALVQPSLLLLSSLSPPPPPPPLPLSRSPSLPPLSHPPFLCGEGVSFLGEGGTRERKRGEKGKGRRREERERRRE